MAFVQKLGAHRDLLGRVLAAGDDLDSMRPGWLEMQAGYEALSTWLDSSARRGPAGGANPKGSRP